ncbi:hypothetical protein GJ496_003802 [Pomphorhynchus laevis]|nr:hypothetical protein GJ496_003802 [Pomphorhynchus laevis]
MSTEITTDDIYSSRAEKDRDKDEDMVFTLAEISKHDSTESCWIVVHGNVYDVTEYLDHHPGGSYAMMSFAGAEDCTDAFMDIGHSYIAKDIMKKFRIGRVKSAPTNRASKFESSGLSKRYNRIVPTDCLQIIVFIFIIIISIISASIYYYEW